MNGEIQSVPYFEEKPRHYNTPDKGMSFMSKEYWAETYLNDLPLFEKLGFKTFKIEIDPRTLEDRKIYLGIYETEDFTVKTWVTCTPGQFFEFSIYNKETQKTMNIKTGSGRLIDYWIVVEKIIDHLLDISIQD